jgi:hypothetical protein
MRFQRVVRRVDRQELHTSGGTVAVDRNKINRGRLVPQEIANFPLDTTHEDTGELDQIIPHFLDRAPRIKLEFGAWAERWQWSGFGDLLDLGCNGRTIHVCALLLFDSLHLGFDGRRCHGLDFERFGNGHRCGGVL